MLIEISSHPSSATPFSSFSLWSTRRRPSIGYSPLVSFTPDMASEEVGTKLVRLLYFVGAGVICTVGINKWRELERKAALKKALESAEQPATAGNGATAES